MTSIRKFVHATLLAAATLSLGAGAASAQSTVHGEFKLSHQVHWQNAIVPAGEYRFSLETTGASGLLTLTKIDSPSAGFMLSVHDVDESKTSNLSRLLLSSTPDGSYVSEMTLPEFGMTLHFAVPAPRLTTTALASGR